MNIVAYYNNLLAKQFEILLQMNREDNINKGDELKDICAKLAEHEKKYPAKEHDIQPY